MSESIFNFLTEGGLAMSWVAKLVYFLVATQLTIFCVTLYLHRSQAHRAVDFHPVLNHLFRLWGWLSTGMVTREWVAVHRKHHAHCETEQDPHSPQVHGIGKVVMHGVALYGEATRDKADMDKYGHGAPNDWLERHFYRHGWLGPAILLIASVAAFGVIGVTIWALQIVWIPFFAAGVVNGLGHWMGYRNFDTPDTAHNLTPVGFFIGGEELHNNHHAFPSSARFSMRRFEFDIGWQVIRALSVLRLAKVRRVAPRLVLDKDKQGIDMETLRAVFAHRYKVLQSYTKQVTLPAVTEEARRHGESASRWRRWARKALAGDERFFSETRRQWRQRLLANNTVQQVQEFRERFQAIWSRSAHCPDTLLESLREWCQDAERSGIESLQRFAAGVRAYRLAAAI
jgi:stearoyl-CoA desaturase (delta-9 desaturase)